MKDGVVNTASADDGQVDLNLKNLSIRFKFKPEALMEHWDFGTHEFMDGKVLKNLYVKFDCDRAFGAKTMSFGGLGRWSDCMWNNMFTFKDSNNLTLSSSQDFSKNNWRLAARQMIHLNNKLFTKNDGLVGYADDKFAAYLEW